MASSRAHAEADRIDLRRSADTTAPTAERRSRVIPRGILSGLRALHKYVFLVIKNVFQRFLHRVKALCVRSASRIRKRIFFGHDGVSEQIDRIRAVEYTVTVHISRFLGFRRKRREAKRKERYEDRRQGDPYPFCFFTWDYLSKFQTVCIMTAGSEIACFA